MYFSKDSSVNLISLGVIEINANIAAITLLSSSLPRRECAILIAVGYGRFSNLDLVVA
jgi:hypothetical protein